MRHVVVIQVLVAISHPYSMHAFSSFPLQAFMPIITYMHNRYSLSLSIPLFTPISYHLFSLYPFIPIIFFLHTHQTRPLHPLSSISCMHPISIKSIASCPCLILSHMYGSLHYPSNHPSNPFSHSKTFSYPLPFSSPPFITIFPDTYRVCFLNVLWKMVFPL